MDNYLKKIGIETVESYLNKKLQRNKVVIGFDVSQHATGIAVLRSTDAYLILELTEKITVPKDLDELDALDLFIAQLDSFKEKMSRQYKFDENTIENCFFGKNIATLKKLARCSALTYDRFRGLSKHNIMIMPTSARAKVGFQKSAKGVKDKELKEELVNFVNEMLDIENKDHDIADAIILAIVGLIIEETKKKSKRKKK